MKKIYVSIETAQGRVLGFGETSKDKITIGRAPSSSLRLDDEKLASLECEIYLLNDECWLQVSKEGSAVSFKGKQFRTLKIEENSVLYFKNLVLKVEFTKPKEIDAEKTRVLSGLEVASVVAAEQEITKADLDLSDKTRVVQDDLEKTRVEKIDFEATKIVQEDFEKTRVVPYSSQNTRASEAPVFAPITEEDIYGRGDEPISFNLRDYLDSKNINFKELGLMVVALVVTIGVGRWLLFTPTTSAINLDNVAQEQQNKLHLADPQRQAAPSLNNLQADATPAEVSTASKEEYLRSLSSLFNRPL